MLIFTKTAELQAYLSTIRAAGKTLGFVPTMGALHAGHVSLVAISKQQCDITLCSIFVNPTQFNDKKDLDRYPRTPEKDAGLLETAGCDALFLPSVEEIYPEPVTKEYQFGLLGSTLEGEFRPGHFNGVAQVVQRFFEIIEPDSAFFGSKDYQQVMIIRALVRQMRSPIRIVACPVLREPDGLAMSSRNTLLTFQEREVAAEVPRMMQSAAALVTQQGVAAAKAHIKQQVALQPLMRLDYYEVANAATLEITDHLGNKNTSYISLIALFVGRIRLIDNLPVG